LRLGIDFFLSLDGELKVRMPDSFSLLTLSPSAREEGNSTPGVSLRAGVKGKIQ
jgi:hypothetical protein